MKQSVRDRERKHSTTKNIIQVICIIFPLGFYGTVKIHTTVLVLLFFLLWINQIELWSRFFFFRFRRGPVLFQAIVFFFFYFMLSLVTGHRHVNIVTAVMLKRALRLRFAFCVCVSINATAALRVICSSTFKRPRI